jgi:hypothetical protein
LRQRAVIFRFGDAIKSVRGEFQVLPIQKENLATAGAAEAPGLQIVHGVGEAWPPHAEQEEFMGDGDRFGADAVVPHQQPARELFVEAAPPARPSGFSTARKLNCIAIGAYKGARRRTKSS